MTMMFRGIHHVGRCRHYSHNQYNHGVAVTTTILQRRQLLSTTTMETDDYTSSEKNINSRCRHLKLHEMIRQIPSCISQRKQYCNKNSSRVVVPGSCNDDPVYQLMRQLRGGEALRTELQPYCYYDNTVPYTRNLISTDHTNYTLLLLCWSSSSLSSDGCRSNSRSPIHNHPGDGGCYMRIISGSIVERLYRISHQSTTTLECIGTTNFCADQVAFINDSIGYHSIECCPKSNVYDIDIDDETQPQQHQGPGAMSLHLYSPPIRQCQIIDVVSSPPQTSMSSSSLYNIGGEGGDSGGVVVQIRDSGPMIHHTEYGIPMIYRKM